MSETEPQSTEGTTDPVTPADDAEPTAPELDRSAEVVDEPADSPVEVTDEPPAEIVDEPAEPPAEVVDEPAAEIVDEPAAEPVAEPVAAAPLPRPVPRPAPRPGPRPGAPVARPTAPRPAPAAPTPPDLTPAEAAEAAGFGRVDADGTVWVREAAGERVVGQYPGAEPAEALALYVRRYADLRAGVLLFETRLAGDLSTKEIEQTLAHLTDELAEPAAVGDLDGLRARLDQIRGLADERRAAAEAERAAAKAKAVEERTALVEAAEKIAGTDPTVMQWRPAGEQLRELLDQWKDAQRHGPRIDRPTEDALWKRFSHARSGFDRDRRKWFADLEKSNSSAKQAKEALVAEAEALATSTDWGATAAAYRDLMTRWRSAGRASRKDDDALWARFRAAQDAFFAARDSDAKATDASFQANLEVKLELLAQAESLLPVRDLAAAKNALRELQEKWEAAGKVPRADLQRVEGRLRAVEQAIRDADQAHWRRTNPETRARAEGAAAQLYATITALEEDLAAAEKAKNARKVAELTAALEARRAWLEQVERAAADSR